jgi:uncharacterized membrane protein YtjA (UPF0391 family)
MIKLAGIWLGVGSVAALFGFSGIIGVAALIAQVLFYISAAFVLLSLLFCLFEAPEGRKGLLLPVSHSPEAGQSERHNR